jgi:hypothetical protein
MVSRTLNGVKNRMFKKIHLIILSTIFCSWLGQAEAIILFDNLGNVQTSFEGGADVWMAQKFTTDTNNYTLDSVSMILRSPNPSGNLTIALFDTMANHPQTPIHILYTGPAATALLTGTFATNTFSGQSYLLNPNSTFWIVAENDPNSESVDWRNTSDSSGTGPGFSADFATSDDEGATWAVSSGQPFLMQVNATVIPEPTSVVMLSIGVLIAAATHKNYS